MPEDKSSRRGFLEIILGAGTVATLGAIVYPIVRFIVPPKLAEANLSQLKLDFTREDIAAADQKAKYFKYGRELGIIYETEKGELKALAAMCTHLDCTVQHRPDLGIIWCSCHNGRYDMNGNNISGPPPRPLAQFKVNEAEDGTLFVAREDA